MHKACLDIFTRLIPAERKGWQVLDVGSLDINGSLRDFFIDCEYTGLDVVAGKNVDIISEPYAYPFEDGRFDLVVSANCLEHVAEPHRWAREVMRVLKKSGTLIVTAPHKIHHHNAPHYWNIRKDGLAFLFKDLEIKEVGEEEKDAFIIAVKRG